MANKLPTAPAHLRPETARWWESVVNEFYIPPDRLRILTVAAEAWDTATAAREVLAESGMTYLDRYENPRPRPENAILRDARLCFLRAVRELNLDSSPAENK